MIISKTKKDAEKKGMVYVKVNSRKYVSFSSVSEMIKWIKENKEV